MTKINIPKVKSKKEDEYNTFSVRLPNELCNELFLLTQKTELSRNEIITILLSEALKLAEVMDSDEN